MSYSQEEITASVQKFIRSSIRRQVDSLGVRKVETAFTDLQEIAASAFLLNQTAPFYIAYLAAQRLQEKVTQLALDVDQLILMIRSTGRVVLPINNLVPLVNARTAIFDLESSVNQRTLSFKQVTTSPGYQRFNTSINQFLSENGSNIKSEGDIVSTPQEAKLKIKTLMSTIKTELAEVQDLVNRLSNALSDYGSVNLPTLVTSGVLKRTRDVVSSMTSVFQSKDPTTRLEDLRASVLDLVSAQSIVTELGTFKDPDPFFLVTGAGGAYSDSSHLGTAAALLAELPAPYQIPQMEQLDLEVDGSPASVYLNGSVYAELSGLANQPFVFTDVGPASVVGAEPAPFYNLTVGRVFSFLVRDVVTMASVSVVVPVPVGAGLPVSDMVDAINLALTTARITDYYADDDGEGHVLITSGSVGSRHSITIGADAGNAVMGFSPGTQAAGTDNNRQLTISVDGTIYSMTFLVGTKTAEQVATQINANLGSHFLAMPPPAVPPPDPPGTIPYVTIRYIGPNPFDATLMFPSPNPAASLLGMPLDVAARSHKSTGSSVALNLNRLSSLVTSSYVVVPATRGSKVKARSDPSHSDRVVLYLLREGAFVAPDGGSALVFDGPAFGASGVLVGDVISVVDGVNSGTAWTVDFVTSDTEVHAVLLAGTGPFVGGACTVEVGPDLGVAVGWTLDVLTGVDKGQLFVKSVAPNPSLPLPFELVLDGYLMNYVGAGTLPSYFKVNVGHQHLMVTSNYRGTGSEVRLSNTAAYHFFASGQGRAIGTTPWVRLPQVVAGLGKDDILEVFGSSYSNPDAVYTIQAVEGSIIKVYPEVPDDALFTFALGTPPPFALLRSSAYERFAKLTEALNAWLDLGVNKNVFLKELDRRVNIVLVEATPNVSQVGDAANQAVQLQQVLSLADASVPEVTLEYALSGYQVARVEPIDSLIATYSEKGAQRALDVLLEARFSDFFGLDSSQVSYSGAMLSQMREVARLDLPVSKIDRVDAKTSRLISTTQSPNFEYDSSDIDRTTRPDLPTNFNSPNVKR